MIEKYLDKLFDNKNYDFSKLKINYIKEDEKFYIIYFDEEIESVGRFLIYKINKSDGENEPVILPDDDNFKLLDKFETCNFVQIPEKYRNKYF